MSLQQNLKIYRDKAGYKSAREFANLLNLPYNSYMSYENKGSWPNEENLCRIASALGCTPNDLLGYTPSIDESFPYYANLLESVEYVGSIKVTLLPNGEVAIKSHTPGLACTFPNKETFVYCFRHALNNMDDYTPKYKAAIDDTILHVLEGYHNLEKNATNIISNTIDYLQLALSEAATPEERGKLKQALKKALSELESSD